MQGEDSRTEAQIYKAEVSHGDGQEDVCAVGRSSDNNRRVDILSRTRTLVGDKTDRGL